jgi:GntR family phosphonate transport system transcriptional regulator
LLEDLVTSLAAPLPRGDGVSLWRQIVSRLEGAIAGGQLTAGARLPTESDLAQAFAVNRHTIRRAMEELATRGLVRVEQGRGSFVAEEVVEYPLGSRTRFSEIIRAQSREPSGRIIRIVEIQAEGRVAELLKLRRGRAVVVADRLSFANGRAITLGTHHFPAHRFSRIAGMLAENPSITAALAASGVPDYRRQVTRITARMPTLEEAQLLGQARTRPVLLTEAVNVDPEGIPVETSISRYAAGRTQLVVESP